MTDSMRDRILGVLSAESVTCGHEWCEGGSPEDCFYCEGVYESLTDALLVAFPWLADEPRCCEHDKCPGGSLCCCQGPSDAEVEAGARALDLHRWDDWSAWADDEAVLVGQAAHRDAARIEARAVLVAAREARTSC